MYWMLLPLKRFADFKGRSRRREYWMFTLGFAILAVVAMLIELALGIDPGRDFDNHPLVLVLSCILFVPSLALMVRRYHDLNNSGWNVLWSFLPFAGIVILLIAMCTDGTPGDNRFGPSPKDIGTIEIEDIFA